MKRTGVAALLLLAACSGSPQRTSSVVSRSTTPAAAPSSTTSTAVTLPGEAPIPDVMGLTLRQAERVLPDDSGGRRVRVVGESLKPSVAPETIVDQTPMPGMVGPGVEVTIAVPSTLPCSGSQLTLAYLGGGVGTGNDFGTVVVRDTSAAWCAFAGPVAVIGLDRNGRPDTRLVWYPVPRPIVLSPDTPAPPRGQVPALTDIEADVPLAADYRDGPQPNGLCDTMQVIPDRWQLTLPGDVVLTVRNDDPANVPLAFQAFRTCRGQMDSPAPVTLSGDSATRTSA